MFIYAPIILIDSFYIRDEKHFSKVSLEKYYFVEDIKIYRSYSDEEYYDEEYMNLFLETLKK